MRILLFLSIFMFQAAQASVSLLTGAALSSSETTVSSTKLAAGTGTGYSVGLLITPSEPKNRVAFELGGSFLNRVVKQSFTSGVTPSVYAFQTIAAPVGISVGLFKGRVIRFLLGVRPEFLMNVTTETTNYNTQSFQLKGLGLSAYSGFRIQFSQKLKKTFFVDARYHYGLLNQAAEAGNIWKVTEMSASLGYAF